MHIKISVTAVRYWY